MSIEVELSHCPHCHCSLDDPSGYRREIGVEIRGLYDGVAYWQCHKCGGAWSRQRTLLSKQEVRELTRGDIFTK